MIATGSRGVLPGMAELAEVATVAGIVGRSATRAREAAERFGIPRVYDTPAAMFADDSIDAVVNLTPIDQHFALSEQALLAGKHLVTEKPIASDVVESDRLISLASERALSIITSPPRMVEPSRLRAREIIRSGGIGVITFARARSSHGGPAVLEWPVDPRPYYSRDNPTLHDLAPYAIHQLIGLLGRVRRVTALSGRIAESLTVENGPFAGTRVDVEAPDNNVLLLDFGSSRFGVVDAGYSVRAATSPAIEIFGTRGTINLYTEHPPRTTSNLEVFQPATGWRVEQTDEDRLEEARQQRLGRAILVDELAREVSTRVPSLLDAASARHAVEIIHAAELSAATGRAVPIAPR